MKTQICGKEAETRDPELVKFSIKDQQLKKVDLCSYSYLAVHIDAILYFEAHHKTLVSHTQSKLSHFRRTRPCIDNRAAKLTCMNAPFTHTGIG